MRTRRSFLVWGSLAGAAFFLAGTAVVQAHCDTMGGPVIQAARKALESGNVNWVLIWVQPKDEAETRAAFAKALAVRKLSPVARELADLYFFENLVRIHRAGEGAPYTGLKSAKTDLSPIVPLSDRAIETGSPDQLLKLLTGTVEKNVREHFEHVLGKKQFKPNDVQAGRGYVEAYVTFTHYVEAIFHAAQNLPAHGRATTGGHEE